MSTTTSSKTPEPIYRNLVIMDGNEGHSKGWAELFANFMNLPDGSKLRIIQASWMEVEMTRYPDKSGAQLLIAPVFDSKDNVKRPSTIIVHPDLLLVRNQLYGLMMDNVPSINSLSSIYMCLERPLMYGAMTEIEKRVGSDKFPVIPITYYSTYKQMILPPETYPSVMKISHAHRGMGKMRVKASDDFRDVATVVALHSDYCTCEPFIDVEYGLRVQKIGKDHYRVFKKVFTGSGWKSQFGGADLQEIPLTDTYKLWADECQKAFGGLDMLAIDALHGKDGKDYIIELNDTAIGLTPGFWKEDSIKIVQIVVARLHASFKK